MEDRGIRCDLFLKINRASSRLLFHVRILTIRITRLFEGRSAGDLPWFLFCEVDLAPVHRPHPDIAKREFSSAFTREYQGKFIRPVTLPCDRIMINWNCDLSAILQTGRVSSFIVSMSQSVTKVSSNIVIGIRLFWKIGF